MSNQLPKVAAHSMTSPKPPKPLILVDPTKRSWLPSDIEPILGDDGEFLMSDDLDALIADAE